MQIQNQKLMDKHKGRNYGIDLLRLVTMFMIVCQHVLGQGGVINNVGGWNYDISVLLSMMFRCDVDCFAIISGYVSYSETQKPHHYKNFLRFWVQVCTYSFGITLIAFAIHPESVGFITLIKALFPITRTQYWYVSAYAGLFVMIPWLNKMLQSCNKKEASKLVSVITTVFVVYVTFSNRSGDVFSLQNGYSFVWLLILYIIGAWMKKCDVSSYLKNSTLVIGIIACVLIAWIFQAYFSNGIFSDFTSFNIVFVAFALVAIFSKLQLKQLTKKFVCCFAPAAFGVYLIHVQKFVWNKMDGAFAWIAALPCWQLVIAVLGSAFCIFACCLMIEKIRLTLFRLLKINKLIDKIATSMENFVLKIYSKGAKLFEHPNHRL